jgi:hypothetical protein
MYVHLLCSPLSFIRTDVSPFREIIVETKSSNRLLYDLSPSSPSTCSTPT